MKSVARAACVLALMTFSSIASADSSAAADELFKQGREALEKGDYETACSKLAESNRLERAVGTLISLAQCEEKVGKLASARQHWDEAAKFADAIEDRLNRGVYAREHFTAIDPRVPRLTVKRAPTAPSTITILYEGASMTSASLDTALPLNPGKHTLVVSAPDYEPKTFDVVLNEGEKREVEVGPGAQKPRAPLPLPVTGSNDTPSTAPGEDKASPYRVTAYGLGGLGIVGLGLGTAFGLMASSSWSDAQSACKLNECGTGSRAQEDKDTASTQGNVSTVAFIGGGVLIAAAAVVWLVAPSSSPSTKTGLAIVPGSLGGSAAYRF